MFYKHHSSLNSSQVSKIVLSDGQGQLKLQSIAGSGRIVKLIIYYKYNKPIRHTIFNFNKLVSDLDIHANTRSL